MREILIQKKATGEKITLQEFAQIAHEIFDFTESLNPDLTTEEIQYLQLILNGYEPDEIMPKMNLPKTTCNKLKNAICKKFKTNDILEAMLYAFLLKIIK